MLIVTRYSNTLEVIAEITQTDVSDKRAQELLRWLITSHFCDEYTHRKNKIQNRIFHRLKLMDIGQDMFIKICEVLCEEIAEHLPKNPIHNLSQSCIQQINKDTYAVKLLDPMHRRINKPHVSCAQMSSIDSMSCYKPSSH